MEWFKSRKKSCISGLKRYWNDFCRRSGYINEENPPTEELYSEYFRKKKEAGETDKGQKISKYFFLPSILPKMIGKNRLILP